MAWLETPFGKTVLLAAGGAAGTVLRYGVGVLVKKQIEGMLFPWHTFAINVAGSALLGWIVVAYQDRPTVLLLLGVGLCGGFTTFSTFSVEAIQLYQRGRTDYALLYVLGSVVAGIAGAAIAMSLAKGQLP